MKRRLARLTLGTLPCLLMAGFALAQATLPVVEGEVRKVDTATSKLTLRHGEIKNLDMSAMTMVFRVKEPELLAKVQAGDRVSFTADKVDGVLTVMSIERTKP